MVHQIQCMENTIWHLLVRIHSSSCGMYIDFSCSCFNAFSRVDVRVEVKIPGGVESYFVDVRGERYVA